MVSEEAREAQRAYRKRNAEEAREAVRAWRKRNPDKEAQEAKRAKGRAYSRERWWSNPEQARAEQRAKDGRKRVRFTAMLASVKLTAGCIDCGYAQHPAALHFDHRCPEDKLFHVSKAISKGKELVWAEIMKCDVRCANCHAARHHE